LAATYAAERKKLIADGYDSDLIPKTGNPIKGLAANIQKRRAAAAAQVNAFMTKEGATPSQVANADAAAKGKPSNLPQAPQPGGLPSTPVVGGLGGNYATGTGIQSDGTPVGGRMSPTNSKISVPGYVPPAYRSWVATAAKSTGLPASLIAAQINDESGFDPTVTSSAGAEGIAQFEPGTFKEYGTGDPYNPSDALGAYTNMMNALLTQYNGNVRDALAAYNAGSENIQAGYGYADNIIAAAGIKGGQVSTGVGFTVPIVRPGGGDAPSGSGSGSDDTSGVTALFTDYENEINAPRTAPQGFQSISQAGWKAPFQWWYSSFMGLSDQDGT
jgi:hypothetical protein